MEQINQNKKGKTGKFVLIGLGIVALGTGGFLLIKHLIGNSQESTAEEVTETFATTTPSSSSGSSSSSSSSGFPLRKGSRGDLVTNLQKALIQKYGAGILPKFGVDGHFGSEVYAALQSKGLPTSVDVDTFTKLVSGSGSSTPTTKITVGSVATELYNGIIKDNLETAITGLKKIKSTSAYSKVNSVFKTVRIGGVRKTIVNALLVKFSSASEKKKLNAQFSRIGLLYDGSKWSLSGISGVFLEQIITNLPCHIWNATGRKIKVPSATILGEFQNARKGVTEFLTMDDQTLYVKTKYISYV
ncbi:MAG: hypothetical protein JKY54_07195 [Flavobacteriales bacterium]|nr:hypothetical protein [Flavobacteriales bacterium]